MVVPPTIGWLFPAMIERLRHQSSPERQDRQSPDSDDNESFGSEPRLDTPRFTRLSAEERRSEPLSPELPLAVQLTRTRTVEPSVEELRRVIFAPLPAPDMDLGAIFDVLGTRFSQQTSISTRVALIGRTRYLRSIHRDLLVRVAQEALLNIQQHAHAGSASLTLRYDVNSIVMLVQDDGSGLADGTYERPGLHALRTMHYRIAEFGGRLDVFETEGGGVTVRTTMPLE
jgi:signal transduction histidine kinase